MKDSRSKVVGKKENNETGTWNQEAKRGREMGTDCYYPLIIISKVYSLTLTCTSTQDDRQTISRKQGEWVLNSYCSYQTLIK